MQVSAADRKLMLVRQCRVLGPVGQNIEIRADRFEEIVNARVNLEFAAARMVMAAQAMSAPFQQPEGTTAEDVAKLFDEERQRRMREFIDAQQQLGGILGVSLGHLQASRPGVPLPQPS